MFQIVRYLKCYTIQNYFMKLNFSIFNKYTLYTLLHDLFFAENANSHILIFKSHNGAIS